MSEPDVSNLLTVAQAIEIIDSISVSPRVITRSLLKSDGFRIARDIVSDRDYPPFDKSLMDGFAIRASDATDVPFSLRVVGEIAAGQSASQAIASGECMSIFTGAPIPDGADAVVPVEFSEARRSDSVTLRAPSIKLGQNIARRGADCPANHVVLRRGAMLTPAAIAVAASVGAADVEVFAPPRVVVLSSGDELVPIDQMPQTAQIRNSNGPMLVSLLERLGCDAQDAGWVPDDPASIRAAIQSVLGDTDALVLSGGMSMGEYDFIPRVLREMNVQLLITKLKIKPGKPFVLGTYSPLAASQIDDRKQVDGAAASATPQAAGTFIFGLPGNPLAGFVCTIRLCARLFARIAGGQSTDGEQWICGKLTDPLCANGPREFYQPAVVNRDGTITPLQWKGSADIYTLAQANALLVRAQNEPPQKAGNAARVLLLPT